MPRALLGFLPTANKGQGPKLRHSSVDSFSQEKKENLRQFALYLIFNTYFEVLLPFSANECFTETYSKKETFDLSALLASFELNDKAEMAELNARPLNQDRCHHDSGSKSEGQRLEVHLWTIQIM